MSRLNVPRNTYTTLPRLKAYLSLGSAATSDDNFLRSFLRRASRSVDRYTKRQFFPSEVTLRNNLPEGDVLRFDFDILEVKGLSDLNGASEIDSGAYFVSAGANYDRTPYDRIVLDYQSGSVFKYSGTDQQAVHTNAIIGYHEDYGNAWVNSGASLTSLVGLATGKTTINVSGSAGENLLGDKPRFEEGNVIKIDEEFMHVIAGNGASGLDVIRAANGTTASAHAASTAVFVFEPMQDIEFATTRLAAMEYHQSLAPYTGRVIALQFGTIENHERYPPDVLEILKAYKKQRVYSVLS